jgi:glycine betaine transporter
MDALSEKDKRLRKEAVAMELKKVLVPIDYSEHSSRALRWGASLAEKYGAQLLLLHVVPKAVEVSAPQFGWQEVPAYYQEEMVPGRGPFQSERILTDLVDKARTELHDLARKELQGTVPVEIRVAVGKPAAEIRRVAQEWPADLIVMGTHGRTGFSHALLGSVAEKLVRSARCPVFTVRATATVTP